MNGWIPHHLSGPRLPPTPWGGRTSAVPVAVVSGGEADFPPGETERGASENSIPPSVRGPLGASGRKLSKDSSSGLVFPSDFSSHQTWGEIKCAKRAASLLPKCPVGFQHLLNPADTGKSPGMMRCHTQARHPDLGMPGPEEGGWLVAAGGGAGGAGRGVCLQRDSWFGFIPLRCFFLFSLLFQILLPSPAIHGLSRAACPSKHAFPHVSPGNPHSIIWGL